MFQAIKRFLGFSEVEKVSDEKLEATKQRALKKLSECNGEHTEQVESIRLEAQDIMKKHGDTKKRKRLERKLAIFLSVLILPVLVFGCNVVEGTKELNHQNREAGKYISANTEDEVIKMAGSVISANSDSIAVDIGEPENPQPYTAETSSELREKQAEEIKDRGEGTKSILDTLFGFIPYGKEVFAGGVSLYGLFEFFRSRKRQKKLRASYEAGEKILADAKKGNYVGAVLSAYSEANKIHGVYLDVKKDIKKLKKTGVLKDIDWSDGADAT